MGLFKKGETLNERIKKLRKESGLTQLELAEKLNITDKAVSKWESGDGNPDISLLPQLAEIFGVTVDYLLTGKQDETISIDDMDSEKREMLFIKKDDLVNFEKYGYVKPNIVLCNPINYGRTSGVHESNVLEAVYHNNSKKIFAALLKESLKNRDEIVRFSNNGHFDIVAPVCGNFDKYVEMCCSSGCVEGLEFINLKYFMVDDKTDLNRHYFHIRRADSPAGQDYFTCALSYNTLKYALDSKTSTKEIIDYLCDVEFFKDNGNRVYFMTDAIIKVLYELGDYKRITKIIDALNEYNQWASELYKESTHGSWYTGKRINGNAIYFMNYDDSYLRAYVYPINGALSDALSKKDYQWVETFNAYNRNLNELIPELKLNVYTEKGLKVIQMENDPKTSAVELLEMKCLVDSYFELTKVLNCVSLDVDGCKENLKIIPDIKTNFVDKYFISPLEMMYVCLEKKDFKPLFKFATDIEYKELQDLILNGDTQGIKDAFIEMFIPNEYTMRCLDNAINSLKNITCSSGNYIDEQATERARKEELNRCVERLTNELISEKQHLLRRKVNEAFFKYLNIQFANIPLSTIYKDLNLASIQKIKNDYVQKCLTYYEDLIEEITHTKALQKEFEKINKELSKDYLLNEIKRGESDKAVVLICKRLQIILQYKYKYEGDLFTMIDSFMKDRLQLHEMINPHDDEDNNYYSDLETDRLNAEDNLKIERKRHLLHKLRMKRNNIVHAETKSVDMTEEEIIECIDLIELLSK